MSDAIKHIADDIFLSGRQRIGAHMHCARKTVHCCGALDFLYPEPCPQQPRAERIDYKI